MNLKVTKRNGTKELFDPEKINKILLWATKNLDDVSASDIAMNANAQFKDGIETKTIHEILIQSTIDLISEKNPNYQYVASNLLNYLHRKEVFNIKEELPDLYSVIKDLTNKGFYDDLILKHYTKEEIDLLNKELDHDRDYNYTYAGLQQLLDKYLVKDRTTNKVYETPQFQIMVLSMTVHMFYDKKTRLKYVKNLYEDISNMKISLSTPVSAGVRTPSRQYSSCCKIQVDDSLDSIFYSSVAVGKYGSKKAGIGLDVSSIRALGSKIRNGEVAHTGITPFLKMFQSTLLSCSQGGIRKGSGTVFVPFWHKEIEDIIVLKNNKGTDDNRVRHIDYAVSFCRLFYQRVIQNKDISLFSPSDVPGLLDVFGYNDKFEELYLKYENDKSIPRKTINALEFLTEFAKERIQTGRLYVLNIDHANSNTPFKERITMSNLCMEVLLSNLPIQSIYDIDTNKETEQYSKGEIALCVLAGINLQHIKNYKELENVCESLVRLLDFVVEYQDYPINASRKMLKRRSLGIGVTNFAYWMAKNGFKYSDDSSLEKVDELFEHIQYYLLKASNKLAKEFGKCEWFDKTTYADGVLPIDRYNKNVDKIVKRKPELDWEGLRQSIKEYGLRNTTLSTQFPAESSSVAQNATNGIEPIRSLITIKKSKSGLIKQVAPEINKLKNKYELAYQMKSNKGYTNIVAVIQKWIDQSISANHYYEYSVEGISIKDVIQDILYSYQMGLKTLYYANTNDMKKENYEEVNKLEINNNLEYEEECDGCKV